MQLFFKVQDKREGDGRPIISWARRHLQFPDLLGLRSPRTRPRDPREVYSEVSPIEGHGACCFQVSMYCIGLQPVKSQCSLGPLSFSFPLSAPREPPSLSAQAPAESQVSLQRDTPHVKRGILTSAARIVSSAGGAQKDSTHTPPTV